MKKVKNQIAPTRTPKTEQCAHVNRHYYGDKPQTCVLPKGHTGPHQAPYIFAKGTSDERIMVSQWSDMAGTRVDEIEEQPLPKRVAEVDSHRPPLSYALAPNDIEAISRRRAPR